MANKREIKPLENDLLNEYNRRLDAVWENFVEGVIYPLYYRSEFTPAEIREAMGGAFDDQGFEEFDECFGLPEDEDEN